MTIAAPGPEDAILVDPNGGEDRLVIAFGGYFGGLNGHPWAFRRWSRTTDWPWIFVRDLRKSWYVRGVADGWPTPESVVDTLRQSIRALDCREVIAVGTSAGGWAAIWLGCLLGVDRVIALSPQTAIDRETIERWHDARFLQALAPAWASGVPIPDLRALLVEHDGRVPIDIHLCRDNAQDERHAAHVEGLPGVVVHRHPCDQHNVAWWLRDEGMLGDVIGGVV